MRASVVRRLIVFAVESSNFKEFSTLGTLLEAEPPDDTLIVCWLELPLRPLIRRFIVEAQAPWFALEPETVVV